MVVHYPRAQFRDTVMLRTSNGLLAVPPVGTLVAVYDVDTSVPITDTIYANDSGPATLPNPMPTGADGLIDFWLDYERQFDVEVSAPGFQTLRTTATSDAAAGLGNVFVDPTFVGTVYGHPAWDEGQDITISEPEQPLIDHGSLDNLEEGNPHPQYLTLALADTRYDAFGTAAAGDTAHTSNTDPHPQYLDQAEGDIRYLQVAGPAFPGALDLAEIATPATPVAGFLRLYAKADHHLYVLDASGTETAVGTATGADRDLRAYVQLIMSQLDPGGPPPPPP